MPIRFHLPPDERLSALRAGDPFREWHSLDDERFCVLCERTFTGRQVRIIRDRSGRFRLRCRTESCKAGPSHWVYPSRPLTSDKVDDDLWHPLGSNHKQPAVAAF